MPLADGRTYWFATASAPEGQRAADGEHAEVLRRFSGWHAPVPELLRATDPGAVLRHDVYELYPHPRPYVRGRLLLLGDAATLGSVLPAGADIDAGLAAYDRARRPRARRIARRSAQLGRVAQLDGRLTSAARNLLVRSAPAPLAGRQFDGLLRWSPPAPPGPADRPEGR